MCRSLRILNVAEGEAVAQAPAHAATGDAASSPTLRSKSLLGCLHKQATTAGTKVHITCARHTPHANQLVVSTLSCHVRHHPWFVSCVSTKWLCSQQGGMHGGSPVAQGCNCLR